MNNYNNKNSTKDIDEIGKKVMKWLTEEKMYTKEAKDEKFYFYFVAKNPNAPPGGSFIVAQPKVRDDLVLVSLTIEFIGEFFEKLRRMTPQEKIDFWTSFGLGIIFATPTFLVRPNEDLPKEIEFRREIYYDSLNKDKLMEAIRDIHRCLLYFHLKLNEQFRDQPRIETSMFG